MSCLRLHPMQFTLTYELIFKRGWRINSRDNPFYNAEISLMWVRFIKIVNMDKQAWGPQIFIG